jgi:hypothetical protein
MKTPVGSIDLDEASTVLAAKIIHRGHLTDFELDGAIDPVTYREPDPAVHTKLKTFLEKELCNLLKAA